MKIYAMTATFGKLEHETLTLQPGLNIITAPNEWGKSTWCAFLVTMLYGLDTRAKTTKTALADKERYAPWSGSPMSGRIDLNWEGRDITIERWTKGRTPMGEFRAYETDSGYAVPELTPGNCGEMLLGVEKSVFLRSSFLRLADLPVTQDESLRRRLNALVTTGDESGDGDVLAQRLKELKNKVRHNRTGLLPQAERGLAETEQTLRELEELQSAAQKCQERLETVETRIQELRNHQDALRYAASLAEAAQVDQSSQNAAQAEVRLQDARQRCQGLPHRETARKALAALEDIQQQARSLEMESQMRLREPKAPVPPYCFSGFPPEQLEYRLKDDVLYLERLQKAAQKPKFWLLLPGLLLLIGGLLGWLWMKLSWLLVLPGAFALVAVLIWLIAAGNRRKFAQMRLHDLKRRYGSLNAQDWYSLAQDYWQEHEEYLQKQKEYHAIHDELEARAAALQARLQEVCGGEPLNHVQSRWSEILAAWDAYADAQRDAQQAAGHAKVIAAMAKPVPPPAQPDSLRYTEAETARILSDAVQEQQSLQRRLGLYQGRMEALGQAEALNARLAVLKARIGKLEDHYAALEYAQKALADASAELQRRFAPRIAARAQALFARLTGGRYDRFTLSEDLSVNAGAAEENTLRTAQWRSEGTADQLYLALRLAVAGELTPEAPLILDDALVRFDDTRLKTALQILREEAETKQVILFTCQTREQNM